MGQAKERRIDRPKDDVAVVAVDGTAGKAADGGSEVGADVVLDGVETLREDFVPTKHVYNETDVPHAGGLEWCGRVSVGLERGFHGEVEGEHEGTCPVQYIFDFGF